MIIMKKINLFLAIFTYMMVISCSKDFSDNDSVDLIKKSVDIERLIEKLGFNTETMQSYGDTIIVEGDIILYKSKLLEDVSNVVVPRQAMVHDIPTGNITLNVYIKGSFNSAEKTIIKNAISEFSDTNMGAYYTGFNTINFVSSESAANVVIQTANLPYDVCGMAEFPTIQMIGISRIVNIGKNMYINQGLFRNYLTTTAQKKHLIVHEFGHMIGLRHTNWSGLGESQTAIVDSQNIGAYTVPGTSNTGPNPDPLSVFNGMTCGESWVGFSPDDKTAVSFLIKGTMQAFAYSE